MPIPIMINAEMATTLTVESAYSTWPKDLTPTTLTTITAAENNSTHGQIGVPGNQNCIYMPMAVTSVPTANTTQDQ
ncbi:hypothetical protein D3C79_540570 [compost metagenome]